MVTKFRKTKCFFIVFGKVSMYNPKNILPKWLTF